MKRNHQTGGQTIGEHEFYTSYPHEVSTEADGYPHSRDESLSYSQTTATPKRILTLLCLHATPQATPSVEQMVVMAETPQSWQGYPLGQPEHEISVQYLKSGWKLLDDRIVTTQEGELNVSTDCTVPPGLSGPDSDHRSDHSAPGFQQAGQAGTVTSAYENHIQVRRQVGHDGITSATFEDLLTASDAPTNVANGQVNDAPANVAVEPLTTRKTSMDEEEEDKQKDASTHVPASPVHFFRLLDQVSPVGSVAPSLPANGQTPHSSTCTSLTTEPNLQSPSHVEYTISETAYEGQNTGKAVREASTGTITSDEVQGSITNAYNN